MTPAKAKELALCICRGSGLAETLEGSRLGASIRHRLGAPDFPLECDPMLTALLKRPVLDIAKVEEWCHQQGMAGDESVEDFLPRHFGHRYSPYITSFINPPRR